MKIVKLVLPHLGRINTVLNSQEGTQDAFIWQVFDDVQDERLIFPWKRIWNVIASSTNH